MNLKALIGNQAYDDLCEKFVEEASGLQTKYANAITAWTSQSKNAVQGLTGIQPGDTVYFSPNEGNGMNGHAGIYMGGNEFLSATDYGVATNDINNWTKSTGQQILGYIPQNNPGLVNQLKTLPINSSGILGGAGPAGGQNASIYKQLADTQSANTDIQNQEQQAQKWQQDYQGAEQTSNWFQQYQQQQEQNAIPKMPSQTTNYAIPVTPGMNAQSTASENWLRNYTG